MSQRICSKCVKNKRIADSKYCTKCNYVLSLRKTDLLQKENKQKYIDIIDEARQLIKKKFIKGEIK